MAQIEENVHSKNENRGERERVADDGTNGNRGGPDRSVRKEINGIEVNMTNAAMTLRRSVTDKRRGEHFRRYSGAVSTNPRHVGA